MTQHRLLGVRESDILWYQRRSFLAGAAAFAAAGGWSSVQAQGRSNIVELSGDALLNGQRLLAQQTIQTGDRIETGPGSSLVFVVGQTSFKVRPSSSMVVERGATLAAVSVLRLIAGGVVSVWGRGGGRRQVTTATLTAGIRGTGVYTEVMAAQGGRSYFCNCYGTVDMEASGDKAVSRADYHQAFWGEVQARNGRSLTAAPAINHGDEELEMLARLINQRTAWQIAGRRGVKDGKGYMPEMQSQPHPADMIGK
jgi:hypothetical protein